MAINARGAKISEKRLKLRSQLWPSLDSTRLWHRKERQGFTTIPRTMPLLMQIMNSLSKGKPVSSAYLNLWCRAYDESFVTLKTHQEMAFSSGFTGQRAVTTWRERIRILATLKFIEVKEGESGELTYALIFNPYLVVKEHNEQKTPGFPMNYYNSLRERAIEIGANDLE